MHHHRAVLLLLALPLFAISCATNPATGQTEFNIISEPQELAMGAEAHKEVLGEFQVYDEKPELNALVDRLGRRIAASSPRPNLPWTFTLLDTPMVNAMALPGGYIYVTRGILERMSSEDELAGVIGHEIAHVAARHSAQSISRATLAQAGLIAAAVAAGEERTERYGGLVMLGAGLLFTKYSRSQETQADLLGTRYMAQGGWNPQGSESMLQALQRLEGNRVGTLERYFMDHPDPKKRVDDVRREIVTLAAADASLTTRAIERTAFVRRLDGMVTGNATADTIIRDGIVYNRTYGLVAHAPRGWKAAQGSGSLFAFQRGDGQQELVYATRLSQQQIGNAANPRAAVRAQLEKMGLTYVDSSTARSATGERFAIDSWSAVDQGTQYEAESTQHATKDGALVFLHLAVAGKSATSLQRVIESLEIGSAAAFRLQPPRLRIATARSGDTWEALATRATGNAKDAEAIAHINGFDYPSAVPAGLLVKLPEEVAGGE